MRRPESFVSPSGHTAETDDGKEHNRSNRTLASHSTSSVDQPLLLVRPHNPYPVSKSRENKSNFYFLQKS
jgi:hypothetical protein